MTNIHPAIDCVVFQNNIVNVKLNVNHVKTLGVNDLHPCDVKPITGNNLMSFMLRPTDQIKIEDPTGQRLLFAFENKTTTQHKIGR